MHRKWRLWTQEYQTKLENETKKLYPVEEAIMTMNKSKYKQYENSYNKNKQV
jgi:hypothetical protein